MLSRKSGVVWLFGLAFALAMVLLAEYAVLPEGEQTLEASVPLVAVSPQPAQPVPPKDFRAALHNIKTIPAHLRDDEAELQVIYAQRIAGMAEPRAGPIALLA